MSEIDEAPLLANANGMSRVAHVLHLIFPLHELNRLIQFVLIFQGIFL